MLLFPSWPKLLALLLGTAAFGVIMYFLFGRLNLRLEEWSQPRRLACFLGGAYLACGAVIGAAYLVEALVALIRYREYPPRVGGSRGESPVCAAVLSGTGLFFLLAMPQA